MDLDMQKEEFSRAYVQAVTACAGFAWSEPSVDDDSVDLTLAQSGGGGTIRSPKLDLQLKCKASSSPKKNTFSHSIKIKNYNDLRVEEVLVPRILVVVLVPEFPRDWLNHSEVRLELRRCGYWTSLRGFPPSTNKTSMTVSIPRAQPFDVTSLQNIMVRIGQGGLP